MKKNHASSIIRSLAALSLACAPASHLDAQVPSLGGGGFGGGGTGPVPIGQPDNASVYSRAETSTEPSYSSGMAPNEFSYSRRSRPGPALVLSFEQTDQEKQNQIEQDLRVMSSLLERNLERVIGNLPTIKMGIPLLARGDARSPQTLYIQGYGAIFLVHVNFPLAGHPEAPKAREEKPKNSEWEAVKEQLYGSPNAGETAAPRQPGYPQAPEFSAERVEAVRDELIRSLKNASNIRGLAPDEVVVVSVQGTGDTSVSFTGTGTGMAGGWAGSNSRLSNQPGGNGNFMAGSGSWSTLVETRTFLSLRAKKSEIDAFAAGTVKFEDFKAKVVQAVYRSQARRETGAPDIYYDSFAPSAK